MNLEAFSMWLQATPASQLIQNVTWIIPGVQSIHILSVAVVIGSALLMDLRLIGLVGRADPMVGFTRRYSPWLWTALIVLLVTGATLIVGEPDRTLQNVIFWSKMVLVSAGAVVTFVFLSLMRKDLSYWDQAERRLLAKLVGALSILIWIAVIFCGRWIAYA